MDLAGRFTYILSMTASKPDGAKTSLSQLGGLRGLLRNPGLVLFTLRRGAHIGVDALGNQFFERPAPAPGGRARRWVVYKGAPEASSIGPEWHAWLHYLTDAPLPDTGHRPWQKPHLPNQTGTVESYRPAGHDYAGGKRAHATGDYESWTPEL